MPDDTRPQAISPIPTRRSRAAVAPVPLTLAALATETRAGFARLEQDVAVLQESVRTLRQGHSQEQLVDIVRAEVGAQITHVKDALISEIHTAVDGSTATLSAQIVPVIAWYESEQREASRTRTREAFVDGEMRDRDARALRETALRRIITTVLARVQAWAVLLIAYAGVDNAGALRFLPHGSNVVIYALILVSGFFWPLIDSLRPTPGQTAANRRSSDVEPPPDVAALL